MRHKAVYRASPGDGIAWVTGASSGIGRATALELARRGFVVAATARRVEALDALASQATGGAGRIVAHPGDVADREALRRLVERVEAELGPIALAYLNAGVLFPEPAVDPGDADFTRTMEVNVQGVLNALAPAASAMARRGRGRIAVTGSLAGYGGLPGAVAYSASKAALIAAIEALAIPLERQGVALQIINPGFVRTPMTQASAGPKPFAIDADVAARRICDGFERGGFEVAFPWAMVLMMKTLNALPYALRFAILRRGAQG